jgi:Homeodomain
MYACASVLLQKKKNKIKKKSFQLTHKKLIHVFVEIFAGKTRTKDKYRVVYTDHQRLELEKEFHYTRYITIRRKAELAQTLALSERQVKIWVCILPYLYDIHCFIFISIYFHKRINFNCKFFFSYSSKTDVQKTENKRRSSIQVPHYP